jgi:glycosyltransferase involved in cell wall biosynthesis
VSSTGNATRPARPLVTLVAPAYNEADNAAGLVAFFQQIRGAYPDADFELVVVDDGSTDGTAQLVREALGEGDVARVASLSRNFGSHAAVSAGFALARGDCAITLSTDLQEPLELIGRFLDTWRSGADIVWGLRKIRSVPPGLANWLSRKFSKVFHRMSDVPSLPAEGPSQVLVSRAVLDAFNAMPERNRNIMGMLAWVGFTQESLYFEQLPRPAGTSKWTNKKKIRLVVDSFVQFSAAPFLIAFLLGLGICLAGFAGGLAVLIVALATLSAPVGWLLILASVFFVGGLNLAALGGFGEYMWRAGDDARRRPVYILRGVQDTGQLGGNGAQPAAATRDQPAHTR